MLVHKSVVKTGVKVERALACNGVFRPRIPGLKPRLQALEKLARKLLKLRNRRKSVAMTARPAGACATSALFSPVWTRPKAGRFALQKPIRKSLIRRKSGTEVPLAGRRPAPQRSHAAPVSDPDDGPHRSGDAKASTSMFSRRG